MTRTPVEERQKEEWTCSHEISMALACEHSFQKMRTEESSEWQCLVLLRKIPETNAGSGYAEIVT